MQQTIKKSVPVFLLLIMFLNVINAQVINNSAGLLWKLSNKGVAQDSYILLSTYSTCETKILLNDRIKLVLNSIKQIVFETGASNKANEAKAKKLIALKSDAQSAKEILTPALYIQLKQKAEDLGLNELYLNEVSLWEITGRLYTMLNPCDVTTPDRIEDVLRYYANKNHVSIKELITIEEQYKIYDKYPNLYMEKSISCLLNKSENVKASIEAKANYYKQENYAGITQTLMNSEFFSIRYSFTDIEMYRMRLLLQRIEDSIKGQPSLILLDTFDVANPKSSIFTLLKDAGYKIEPVIK